ncbi:MAG: monooxygenase [Gammaproteobacteria bacterium]|nr:MAG: monooxygenase [Gammaproteobacteria bacterium]
MTGKKNTPSLIFQDNPGVNIQYQSGMVRLERAGSLTVKRETVEENLGREWDVQEMHLVLISLAGNIDKDDDKFELS